MKAWIRSPAEREEERLYRQRASREYLDAIEPIGTDWVKPHVTDAPYLIVDFEQAWRWQDGEKRKHYYVRESVGLAVGRAVADGFLKEILHRPDNERPLLRKRTVSTVVVTPHLTGVKCAARTMSEPRSQTWSLLSSVRGVRPR